MAGNFLATFVQIHLRRQPGNQHSQRALGNQTGIPSRKSLVALGVIVVNCQMSRRQMRGFKVLACFRLKLADRDERQRARPFRVRYVGL